MGNSKGPILFGGKSPKDVREMFKIPKGWRVEEFLGVPIEKVPRAYLYALIDGTQYELHELRKRVLGAIDLGEQMKKDADAAEEKQTVNNNS